jgi:hypothetical protein
MEEVVYLSANTHPPSPLRAQCLMVRRWRLIGHFPILYNLPLGLVAERGSTPPAVHPQLETHGQLSAAQGSSTTLTL